MTQKDKKKGSLCPRDPGEIEWNAMIKYIKNLEKLEKSIAKDVMEHKDGDTKMNLMMWSLMVGNEDEQSLELVELILKLSPSKCSIQRLKVKDGPTSDRLTSDKLVNKVKKLSQSSVEQRDKDGSNCLHFGMHYGTSVEIMKILLNDNPEALMEKDKWGQTPLHHGIASTKSNASISKEMVELIIRKNSEITEVQDRNGFTPLQLAIEYKRSDKVVLFLLDAPFSKAIKKKNNNRNNALHSAINNESSEKIIQPILKDNPQLASEKNNDGYTPLHMAIKKNSVRSLEIAQSIVKLCSKATLVQDDLGHTPFQLAIEKKRPDEVVLLLLETDDSAAFSEKDKDGNDKIAIKKKGNDGNNALHSAIKNESSKEIIQRILKAYPQLVLEKNNEEDTPLHIAIKNNPDRLLEIVRSIVESCPMAKLIQDKRGYTPSKFAKEKNRLLHSTNEKEFSNDVIDTLSETISKETISKEDLLLFANRKDDDGNIGLHSAIKNEFSMEIIRLILNANPQLVLEKNKKGDTPLHMAIKKDADQSPEIVLSIARSCPMAKLVEDGDGDTPSSSAIKKKLPDEVIKILSIGSISGRDLLEFAKQKNNNGDTGLHLVMQSELSLCFIQCILAEKPQLASEKNNDGDTPLLFGIKNNKVISKEAVQWFVESFPETLLEPSNDGETPLSSAIEKKLSKGVIDYLISKALPSLSGTGPADSLSDIGPE